MSIIRDMRTLRKLSEAGIVVLHPHTGKKNIAPFGARVTAYYVDDVNRNREGYSAKYIDGSFFPYVDKRSEK